MFDVSPDGSLAKLTTDEDYAFEEGQQPKSEFEVYVVATGEVLTLSGAGADLNWTPDGNLFTLDTDGRLTTCLVASRECVTEQLDLPVLPYSKQKEGDYSDELFFAGVVVES